MIDTHAHLINEFYDNMEPLVNDLKKYKMEYVINCADSLETSYEVVKTNKRFDFLLPTVGIHPQNIDDLNVNEIDEIENIIKNNKVYAIGEIGLDYHYSKENSEKQKEFFIRQIELSIKYNLPILIHSRDAIQECYNIIKKYKPRGIIHCFSGSYEMAQLFIKEGFYLGIGGVLTFKNSKLYELINKIELKHIVLETDSPFLSPEPFRGQKNYPYRIYEVAKKIAEIKHISTEEVLENNRKNAYDIFDLKQ